MPASADLLKVLAEDPKSLEQQFGCMTGIFQIFDRHQAFIGRRYGSKRVSNASGEKLSVHFLSFVATSATRDEPYYLPA